MLPPIIPNVPAMPPPPAPPLTPAPPLPPVPPPQTPPAIHINPPIDDAMAVESAHTFVSAHTSTTGHVTSSALSGSSSALLGSLLFATTSSSADHIRDQAASPPDEAYKESEPGLEELHVQMARFRLELVVMINQLDSYNSLVELHMNSSKYRKT